MRKFAAALFCLISALCLTIQLHAQNYVYATGNPSFSTQIPIENGFINVNNGEVHIEIPLATHTQRGRLQLNERLVYDSRIWKIIDNNGYSWQPTNVPNSMGGWRFYSGDESGTVSYINTSSSVYCYGQVYYNNYYGFTWTDPQGTQHLFPGVHTVGNISSSPPNCTSGPGITAIPNSTGNASDGSGYVLKVTNYIDAVIVDKYGNTYNPTSLFGQASNNIVSDTNGNYWSLDSNGNLVDTLGRTPVEVSTSGNHIYHDVLTVGGTRSRYTVTTETVNYNTAFGQEAVTDTSGSFTAIQSIQLPDGSAYSFTYDSGISPGNYGELTSITLPTGGVIQYTYTNFLDSFQNENRWIHTRVRDGGTTTFAPITISNCSSSAGCQEKTTVSSPSGNDTVYTFTLDNGSILNAASWNTGIDVFQGAAVGGTKLKSIITSYNYTTGFTSILENGNSEVTGTYEYPTSYTVKTVLPDAGLTSQTITTLDSLGSDPAVVQTWDYYSSGGSAPSAPTQETDYTYAPWTAYPTQVIVKDGSGNLVSQTTYGYDQTSPAATSGLSHHNSASGSRYNLTTTTQYASAGSTLTTTATYDDAGTLLTSTDPNGTTTYGHDSTDTFVTSTTPPTPSSGVSLATSASYDSSTGLLNSTTDANGTQTVYQNYDAFGRVGDINTLDSSGTMIGEKTFHQLSTVERSWTDHQNASAFAYTDPLVDNYGRSSRTAVLNGSSSSPFYLQDTCYDANGNVSFQSYRYQGGTAGNPWSTPKVCSGSGDAYTYDALGRVKSITHADGTNIQYSYTGRATKVTDENGVSRITQEDGLGRTTAVCEVSNNSLQGDSPSPCGLDIAGTGYLTTYSYDLANHKTTITQGVQQRVFQTDWLGRTILTQEPERGQTIYSYAYNGTGLLVTRKRPRANQTNAGVLTTTSTQYDTLGRIVSIGYDDGTPTKSFSYDQATAWGDSSLSLGASKGHLTEVYTATSPQPTFGFFIYDAMGRIQRMDECLPSGCDLGTYEKSLLYTYDWLGNMLSSTDGIGVESTYSYTPANELASITSSADDATHPPHLISNVQYGPNGPTSYQLGNGLFSVFGYDGLGRRSGGWVCSGTSAAQCSGGTQLYAYGAVFSGSRPTSLCDAAFVRCESSTTTMSID